METNKICIINDLFGNSDHKHLDNRPKWGQGKDYDCGASLYVPSIQLLLAGSLELIT